MNTTTPLPAQTILFDDIDWQQLAPGLRAKVKVFADKQLRLVEFGLEFVEPDWCTRGHAGYVLEGEMQIEFKDTIMTLRAGNGLYIPAGPPHRHYKTVSKSLLFLIEES